jgi:hypothetical protein
VLLFDVPARFTSLSLDEQAIPVNERSEMKPTTRGIFLSSRSVVALCLAFAGLGCGDEGAAFEVQTDQIVNGTDVTTAPREAVVAVYHRQQDNVDSPWYPHPCTGIVLNPSGLNTTWVLTARHCIVLGDQDTDGTPLSPSSVKISGGLSPGATPPFDAVSACNIFAPPVGVNYLDLSQTIDLAIIQVCDLIPGASSAVSVPLFMAASSDLQDQFLEEYGYGCSVGFGQTCTGGGRLRYSSGHQILSFTGTTPGGTGSEFTIYRFSDGLGGAYQTSGDSGGPSFWTAPNSLKVQIGVHKGGGSGGNFNTDTAISRISNQWVQAVIQHVFIRPHNATSEALTRSSTFSGASLSTAATISVNAGGATAVRKRQWFRYDFPTRHIIMSVQPGETTTCLNRKSDDTLQMATCSSSSTQKWWITESHTITTNDSHCLTRQSGGSVVLATCSTTSTAQKWYIDADSHVPGVL